MNEKQNYKKIVHFVPTRSSCLLLLVQNKSFCREYIYHITVFSKKHFLKRKPKQKVQLFFGVALFVSHYPKREKIFEKIFVTENYTTLC